MIMYIYTYIRAWVHMLFRKKFCGSCEYIKTAVRISCINSEEKELKLAKNFLIKSILLLYKTIVHYDTC